MNNVIFQKFVNLFSYFLVECGWIPILFSKYRRCEDLWAHIVERSGSSNLTVGRGVSVLFVVASCRREPDEFKGSPAFRIYPAWFPLADNWTVIAMVVVDSNMVVEVQMMILKWIISSRFSVRRPGSRRCRWWIRRQCPTSYRRSWWWVIRVITELFWSIYPSLRYVASSKGCVLPIVIVWFNVSMITVWTGEVDIPRWRR